METSIYVYPWDIVDEGITEPLRTIKDIGIDGISLAVSYHSGRFLLPHNPRRKVYYHQGGTVYFSPQFHKYRQLVPRLGEAFLTYREKLSTSGEDLLERIIDEARNVGLSVMAWVVGCHNSRLGRLFPQYTIQNAFGDIYYHGLCPSQQEVRHYLLQMLEDLVNGYELDGLELESYSYTGFIHREHHEIIGVADVELLENILGLCFCPECERRGKDLGIDVDRLKDEIKTKAGSLLRMDAGVGLQDVEGLARYRKMRAGVVEEIYSGAREITDRSGKKVKLLGICSNSRSMQEKQNGVEPAELDRYVDGWVVIYPERPDEVDLFVSRAKAEFPAAAKLIGGLRLIPPQLTHPDQLDAYFDRYLENGISRIRLYNYGLALDPVLEKVKECLSA